MGKKYSGRRIHPGRAYARPDVRDDYPPDDPPAHIRYWISHPPPRIKDGWGDHLPPEEHQVWYQNWCDHRPEPDDTRLDRSADGYIVEEMKHKVWPAP